MNPQWIEIALVIGAYIVGRIEQFVRDAKTVMSGRK